MLEEKTSIINNLEKAVHEELKNSYEEEKDAVYNRIAELESNPGKHRNILSNHIYVPRLNKTVREIKVHEEIYPLENADLDEQIDELKDSVEKGLDHIETYRTSIETLFDEEYNVAQMFKLLGEI
ncbi:hypothetical protein [Oceanobacillus sp. CFH 90083]|uniref:hypothetical protein n=1 Tax=Oceanobacillus sp. CFH 90083 TaxID=2592336 RepID=UPI001D155D3D|nr:hypothetical protein [Oceanobacillus sp. CFH 90083]